MQEAAKASKPEQARVDALSVDYLLAGLVLLARYHGVAANPAELAHTYGHGERLDETATLLAARKLGLKARFVDQPAGRLEKAPLPAIALMANGAHVILSKLEGDTVVAYDLAEQRARTLPRDVFLDQYVGRILLVASRQRVTGKGARFDLRWFVPAVMKYRRLFAEVIVASLFVQAFALMTPLLFQVVMDKVLVHRTVSTLDVVALGIGAIALFEVMLSGLRAYILAHTTSKIDVELGARLFRHVLALPLAYFESRRVGETVARVRELENIRNFLTGQALTALLDLFFTVVFLAVMVTYSGWLTLIVVISMMLYGGWSAVITPGLRRGLDEKFARGAENQSFLVEAMTGIGTIKATATAPRMTRTWDMQLAAYVSASLTVVRRANLGQQGIQLIQKTVAVTLLYVGARLVIEGDLTVGQLIAFNMLSGQVAAPVVRLAQLWQDFQQVGISVKRLGDVLNMPTEQAGSSVVPAAIKGKITFERTSFRYRPDGPEILAGVDLRVAPGEVIGIVGRSGSGKSTLTKLVQRLYVPERGRVLIDGQDIAMVDPTWLRRQIGVVLQENFLFGRSVRENIALGDPGASLERVMAAARLAGAHDFILELPEGYDTHVGERGGSLSGGQRQRVAIARALMADPRILIFDEATSALDYESEHAVMANMRSICRGRTVLIIAHRLSTVRRADRIVVMERGQIVEDGTHDILLKHAGGVYARLHALQGGAA
ncbi:type I secretion system permease/ATPase [Bacillus sp. NP157]|nr:type I secretion system permease/ATPase [Bacillus sp. NP157]